MIATRRYFLAVLLLAGLIASTARAEKIRTAVPRNPRPLESSSRFRKFERIARRGVPPPSTLNYQIDLNGLNDWNVLHVREANYYLYPSACMLKSFA